LFSSEGVAPCLFSCRVLVALPWSAEEVFPYGSGLVVPAKYLRRPKKVCATISLCFWQSISPQPGFILKNVKAKDAHFGCLI
jgi:hypothetical protein